MEGQRKISSIRIYRILKNLSPRKLVLDAAGYLKEDSNSVSQKKRQKLISEGLIIHAEEFGFHLKFSGKP